MSRPRNNGLCAIVAIAALTAGCGGGAYTKGDFIARANAICASSLRQARSAPSGVPVTTYLEAVLPILRSEADQLLSLRRPPDDGRDRSILNRYFSALAQTLRDYHQLEAAAKRNDQETVSSIEAALASSPLESLATSYGLRSCGPPTATVG